MAPPQKAVDLVRAHPELPDGHEAGNYPDKWHRMLTKKGHHGANEKMSILRDDLKNLFFLLQGATGPGMILLLGNYSS